MMHSTIRCTALALIASLAAGSTLAQDRTLAYISTVSPAEAQVVDLSDIDGITAAATITEGYVYGALFGGTLTSGAPFPTSIQPIISKESNVLGTGVYYNAPTGRFANAMRQGEAYATANEGRYAASLTGSLMTVSVTAHTRVTIDSTVYGALEVPRLEGYQAPTDDEMASMRSVMYSYLGPVDPAVLATSGVGAQLFAPDAQGYICPGCLGELAYWTEYFTLDPSMSADASESGGLMRELTTNQQYTLINDGDTTRVFHVLRFAAAAAMNVMPVSSVPEPGSVALLSCGLAIMGLRRRASRR